MRKKRLVSLISVLAILLFLVGCGGGTGASSTNSDGKIIMKLAHGCGLDDPHQYISLLFKEKVEEYSDGRIEVEVYPAGQLGSEQRAFQDVQMGVLEAVALAVNNVTVFSPSLGFMDLPYIFESRGQFNQVIDVMWDDINEKMIKESGTRAIMWFPQGFRVVTNSKQPVETIDDLSGLKIRVPQNPIMLDTFNAWGALATPVAWDETFNAMQQKVVDGQENPYTVINSQKIQEVQKYLTDIHYKLWIGPCVINERWFQSQPKDIQEIILKAGRDASTEYRDWIEQEDKRVRDILIADGMVDCGTPKDEDVWAEKAMALWPKFYKTIGGTELVEEAMAIMGREMPKS